MYTVTTIGAAGTEVYRIDAGRWRGPNRAVVRALLSMEPPFGAYDPDPDYAAALRAATWLHGVVGGDEPAPAPLPDDATP